MSPSERPLLVIILAAGKGTRMRSSLPKVLHKIAGQSMLAHVMATAGTMRPERMAVVVGPDMEKVRAEAQRLFPAVELYEQTEQRGTGHAVLAARPAIAAHRGDVIVLFADTPLFKAETLQAVRSALASGTHISIVGFEAADPTGYGRILTGASGEPRAIREHNDANAAERETRLCNAGVMGVRGDEMLAVFDKIDNRNAKREFYQTDAVEIAHQRGLSSSVIVCPEDEVLGINSRDQLAAAEAIWQRRARLAAMQSGVTMIAPETVWLSHDTRLGEDVTIEPNVFLGPGVTVEHGATIRANCHIEGAVIGPESRIGPFARLRPGAALGRNVRVGNFVEVKAARMEDGAKANHLAYIGDGRVGEGANIGAGTIFCNYDGFNKHFTDVGKGAFVGSNSSLVAPIKIGDGAFIGSGSIITEEVPADALALERSKQDVRPGWAAKFRTLMGRRKKAR